MKKYWPFAMEYLFPSIAVNITSHNPRNLEQYHCRDGATVGSANSLGCSVFEPFPSILATKDTSSLYATPQSVTTNKDPVCGFTWQDPMQDMINKLQSLAFRITVDMANSDGSALAPAYTGAGLDALRESDSWRQPVAVTGHRIQTVYKTNNALVAIGVLFSMAGVIAILPLYAGFWELGRKFSMDPLEIARAFGAPLLEGVDGNATSGVVALERGGMSVRYGAIERCREEKKLRIDEAKTAIRTPWKGEIFG